MSHWCGDSDTYAVYDETYPRARKDHRCDACKGGILRGTLYARVSWIYESEVAGVKRCLRCQALHLHLRELAPGEMWPDERLSCGQDYVEEWGELPEAIAALAFVADGEVEARLALVGRANRRGLAIWLDGKEVGGA